MCLARTSIFTGFITNFHFYRTSLFHHVKYLALIKFYFVPLEQLAFICSTPDWSPFRAPQIWRLTGYDTNFTRRDWFQHFMHLYWIPHFVARFMWLSFRAAFTPFAFLRFPGRLSLFALSRLISRNKPQLFSSLAFKPLRWHTSLGRLSSGVIRCILSGGSCILLWSELLWSVTSLGGRREWRSKQLVWHSRISRSWGVIDLMHCKKTLWLETVTEELQFCRGAPRRG